MIAEELVRGRVLTPEGLVRAIFSSETFQVVDGYYAINTKLSDDGTPNSGGKNWLQRRISRYSNSVFEGYQDADIQFREVTADTTEIDRHHSRVLRIEGGDGLDEVFWVAASVIAEPRVRGFDTDFREWTAVRITMQIPSVFVQNGVGYQILTDLDQEVMQMLRASGRFVNSTFVSDYPGDGRSIERDRTVLLR